MAVTPPDIALAMRRMGWNNASALMTRWVNGNAWTMTEAIKGDETDPTTLSATQVHTSTITMAWLKGFPGPRAAYDDLCANALNVPGQSLLRARLKKAGWTRGVFVHGSTRLAAPQLGALGYVNSRPFGGTMDTLNDLYGAIGRGMLHAAAVGRVEARGKGHVFVVDRVGIYLRDAYDFNDDDWIPQPLGIWNKQRCLSKTESAAFISSPLAQIYYRSQGFEEVFNATFRRWRDTTGRGGDFLVYSDVEWIAPTVREIAL
ncbi:MAG: DUF6402 family protein [Burkholderiales bacterium]|nr:DUF6402 family protein [Burkholderiales bacterium]